MSRDPYEDCTYIGTQNWCDGTTSATSATSTTTSSYECTYSTSYVFDYETGKKIKKLIKKMTDEMCKIGWTQPKLYYYQYPQVVPVNLRGVRTDGRGWAT